MANWWDPITGFVSDTGTQVVQAGGQIVSPIVSAVGQAGGQVVQTVNPSPQPAQQQQQPTIVQSPPQSSPGVIQSGGLNYTILGTSQQVIGSPAPAKTPSDWQSGAMDTIGGFTRQVGTITEYVGLPNFVDTLTPIKYPGTNESIMPGTDRLGAQNLGPDPFGREQKYGAYSAWSLGVSDMAVRAGWTSPATAEVNRQAAIRVLENPSSDFVSKVVATEETWRWSAYKETISDPGKLPVYATQAVMLYPVTAALETGITGSAVWSATKLGMSPATVSMVGAASRYVLPAIFTTAIAGETTKSPSGWFTDFSPQNMASNFGQMTPALVTITGVGYATPYALRAVSNKGAPYINSYGEFQSRQYSNVKDGVNFAREAYNAGRDVPHTSFFDELGIAASGESLRGWRLRFDNSVPGPESPGGGGGSPPSSMLKRFTGVFGEIGVPELSYTPRGGGTPGRFTNPSDIFMANTPNRRWGQMVEPPVEAVAPYEGQFRFGDGYLEQVFKDGQWVPAEVVVEVVTPTYKPASVVVETLPPKVTRLRKTSDIGDLQFDIPSPKLDVVFASRQVPKGQIWSPPFQKVPVARQDSFFPGIPIPKTTTTVIPPPVIPEGKKYAPPIPPVYTPPPPPVYTPPPTLYTPPPYKPPGGFILPPFPVWGGGGGGKSGRNLNYKKWARINKVGASLIMGKKVNFPVIKLPKFTF